uniref:Ig-like domain-containing protein n=1 Tax=Electrophorus electricus TaxID=8005 RepID=A0AAY5ERT5_ELEEL
MSVQITSAIPLVFLIISEGGWNVNYSPKSICALNVSTVTMGCTYTYPSGYVIVKTLWSTELVEGNQEPSDISLDAEYRDRVEYLGDKQSNCTLILRDVTEQDQRKYYFRFITNTATGKWQGQDGVQLFVTDLQVETPEEVVEGDDVTLTCKTTCNLTGPSYIWYKNGVSLSSTTKALNLKTVSSEHAGSYSCAVLGQSHSSSAVILDVRYAPKRASVSITPSGEIVEGSSVTLTCSSDANPPVQSYNWYKEKTLLGKENTYIIPNISSEDSGEYKCKSTNQHGSKYSSVILNVMYPPKNVSVSISPSGEIVEGSSVTLTCSSDANPPVQNYTWFKEGGTSPVGSGQTYSFTISSSSSGWYYCVAQNKYGSHSSALSVILKGEKWVYTIMELD